MPLKKTRPQLKTKTKPKPRSHDTSYKRLFSHRELVADLIIGYVDPRVAQSFDLTTLERCNGSYVSRNSSGLGPPGAPSLCDGAGARVAVGG